MRFTLVLSLVFFLVLSGCNREEVAIREQKVPKQNYSPVMASAAMPSMPGAMPSGKDGIVWKVPTGWKELPGSQMRIASFQVSPENPDIQLTVIPLGPEGGLLANINRWEGQIGLPPSPESGLAKIVTAIQVDGHPVDMVDMLGPESATPRLRLLGAVMPHGEKVYYFKLSGRADVVGPQKENFNAFINSIRFTEHNHGPVASEPIGPTPTPMPATPAQAEAPAGLSYSAPQGWIKDAPMPLRVVSFRIGAGAKLVEVIVSRMPATGSGSYLSNINRWRGQVGLPPSNQDDPQPVKPMIIAGVDGMIFDYVGPGDAASAKRMLLAWAPKGDDWWFFKMLGPAEGIAQQEAAFNEFMKSVKFE